MIMKKLLALALAAILVLGLAACGSTPAKTPAATDSSAAKTNEDTQTTAPVEMETITVWSDNAHEETIRRRQIEEFNNGVGKELGIYIDYTVMGDKFKDTVQLAVQAGEAPDLFRSDSKVILDYIENGYIIPIDELPGSEELLSKYSGIVSNRIHVFDGKTYTLPYNLTTYGFIINKDLFKECGLTEADYPQTWEDVIRVGKIITEKTNGRAYGLGLSSTLWCISSFYTMPNGKNVGHYGFNYDTKQFEYSAYNPMIEAIDQMVADGSVFPGFENLDGDGVRAQFAAGNIAMIGAASFDCAVYVNQFPATCDWEVINVPKFSADAVQYKPFGNPTQLLNVSATARKHPEKVLKVLEFFYDDKNMAEMYEAGLYIPVRKEAIALATKEPEMKGWASFANFDEIFTMPAVPDTLISLEGPTYREVIANIWANPAKDDVASIMADCDKRYNDALAQVDPAIVAQYALPEGVTPVAGK